MQVFERIYVLTLIPTCVKRKITKRKFNVMIKEYKKKKKTIGKKLELDDNFFLSF